MTVEGSSSFRVIIFNPYSLTFKAYELEDTVLKKPALQPRSVNCCPEEDINEVDDFLVSGSVSALASDSRGLFL